jgi:hypothetical protein
MKICPVRRGCSILLGNDSYIKNRTVFEASDTLPFGFSAIGKR